MKQKWLRAITMQGVIEEIPILLEISRKLKCLIVDPKLFWTLGAPILFSLINCNWFTAMSDCLSLACQNILIPSFFISFQIQF